MKQGTLIFLPATMLACLAAVYPESLVRILAAWTSATFCWVAAGYFWLGPRIFGKRSDGSVSSVCLLLLAPYVVLGLTSTTIARYIWVEVPVSQLTNRLYFGRRLLGRENHLLEECGVVAVLDLTGAFPEPKAIRTGRSYRAITLLDTTSPSLDVLRDAIQWFRTMRRMVPSTSIASWDMDVPGWLPEPTCSRPAKHATSTTRSGKCRIPDRLFD